MRYILYQARSLLTCWRGVTVHQTSCLRDFARGYVRTMYFLCKRWLMQVEVIVQLSMQR